MKNYHKQLSLYSPHEVITYKIQPTNLMYKKEVEYFMSCLQKKVEPMNNIREAIYVTNKVLESFGNYPSTSFVNTAAKEDTCPNWQQDIDSTLH